MPRQVCVLLVCVLGWLYFHPLLEPMIPLLQNFSELRHKLCHMLPNSISHVLCTDLHTQKRPDAESPERTERSPDEVQEHGPQLRLFTPEQLARYDGGPSSPGLYLALLGSVFDVQKGAQHYKPGGGYSFFAGRDATRAYVTGEFTESGLVDDVDGLDDQSLLGIEEWLNFYRTEYRYVGKMIGRFYNRNGDPTPALQQALSSIEGAKNNKQDEEMEKQVYPPCNSEWSSEKGGRVWCTTMSGGIDRTWSGVPRKLFKPGHTEPRCACVRDRGPPSDSPDDAQHQNRGDLDNPNLREYEGCPPDATSCSVSDN